MSRRFGQLAISTGLLATLGFYGVGLAIAWIGLALLERVGLPGGFVDTGLLIVIGLSYAGAGLFCRTMRSEEFSLAGRRLSADTVGLAAAADWLPGTVLLAILGGLMLGGGSALAWILGWAAGLVVMATLVVPGIRRIGSESVPDYLADRFGGRLVQLFGVVILLTTAILFLAAEARVIGKIVEVLLGINANRGTWIVFASLAVCVALGGMRAVVAANATQFLVIFVAFAVPAVWLSLALAGTAVPHAGLGQAIAAQVEAVSPTPNRFHLVALMLTVIAGTAAMPHLVGRYLTTRGAASARRAVVWSLLFLVVLLLVLSTYAAFAGWQLRSALVGILPAQLPDWVLGLGGQGLMQICGIDAVSAQVVASACRFAGDGVRLTAADIAVDPVAVIAAAPRAAGLPVIMAGIAAIGALTAAMATVNGLLLALANAVCGDLYRGVFGRRASAGRRLLFGRIAVLIAAGLAIWATGRALVDPVTLVAWTFSLAGAGLLPALILGVWWPGLGRVGVLTGMATGFLVTAYYILGTTLGLIADWTVFGLVDTGVSNQVAAILGLPAGAAVMVLTGLAIDERRFLAFAGRA